MSLGDNAAKGLAQRFNRENDWQIASYKNRLRRTPEYVRPEARQKLVDGYCKALGPALSYCERYPLGPVWSHWQKMPERAGVGSGFTEVLWVWPDDAPFPQRIKPKYFPYLVSDHLIQRTCQAPGFESYAEIGRHLYEAVEPLVTTSYREVESGAFFPMDTGAVWLISRAGAVLVQSNEQGMRVAHTYIARPVWDAWREDRWGRYLGDERTILAADGMTGDLINVSGADDETIDRLKPITSFNLERLGFDKDLH